MGRLGKIARLPEAIREEVNRRLEKGDKQRKVADWLNSLPEAQEVIAREFGGRPIRQQNLAEWKAGGYRYGALERKLREQARQLAREAPEVAAADGQITDHLATVLSAQYAAVLADWDGIDISEESQRKQKVLHGLCHDIVGLRRGDHGVLRWKTQQERKKLRDENKAAPVVPTSAPPEQRRSNDEGNPATPHPGHHSGGPGVEGEPFGSQRRDTRRSRSKSLPLPGGEGRGEGDLQFGPGLLDSPPVSSSGTV